MRRDKTNILTIADELKVSEIRHFFFPMKQYYVVGGKQVKDIVAALVVFLG